MDTTPKKKKVLSSVEDAVSKKVNLHKNVRHQIVYENQTSLFCFLMCLFILLSYKIAMCNWICAANESLTPSFVVRK